MNTTLTQYTQILRERWRWVAWGAITATVIMAAVLLLWPPRYRSESLVFVRTPGDISQVVDGGDTYAQTRAETYAALARSAAVSSRVIADTGLQLTPQKFASRVQARHIGGTALLQIRVSGPSPDETVRSTQALTTELAAEVNALEAVPGGLTPRAELVVVDPPSRPTRIVAWGAPLYPFVIGPIALGAFLGALGAVIRAMRSPAYGQAAPATDENMESVPSSNGPEAL
jgi:capsular polysaccharide biosynthesis protein